MAPGPQPGWSWRHAFQEAIRAKRSPRADPVWLVSLHSRSRAQGPWPLQKPPLSDAAAPVLSSLSPASPTPCWPGAGVGQKAQCREPRRDRGPGAPPWRSRFCLTCPAVPTPSPATPQPVSRDPTAAPPPMHMPPALELTQSEQRPEVRESDARIWLFLVSFPFLHTL